MRRVLAHLMLGSILLAPAPGHAADPAGLEARRKSLESLLHEQWEYRLRTNPEFASNLGDKRYNDQLKDNSEAAVQDDLDHARKFLAAFSALDTAGFTDGEMLDVSLMRRNLGDQLDNAKFTGWRMPVTQFGGIHLSLPQMVSLLSFKSVKDYEDYVARLRRIPWALGATTDPMRRGMADSLMPPRFLLEKVAGQCRGLASGKPEETPFAKPFEKFPAEFSRAECERIRQAGMAAIRDSVLPAYQKFTAFVRDEYAPHGRREPGMWSLPDGEARYAARVRTITTTDATPAQIHELGLAQVADVEARMRAIAQKLGYTDLPSLNAAIEKDPRLHARSREEILALYRKYIDAMWLKLPQLFGRLPKARVEVLPVEEFREKEAAGAQYQRGTPDGSRPGHVMVNTGDPTHRKLITCESTAYHEGVPGHHLQISIAQELTDVPPFRKFSGYTAYSEGWGLYSEELGKDVGFYADPYSEYGHLQDEMLRAIRLVVDTGLHYKHWSRQQVVDFFHAHSGIDEVDVQAETDRYIAVPGQALAYKMGQLKILDLRARARAALGDKFDIRAFHDEVLGAGALPLDVLDQRVSRWISSVQAEPPAEGLH